MRPPSYASSVAEFGKRGGLWWNPHRISRLRSQYFMVWRENRNAEDAKVAEGFAEKRRYSRAEGPAPYQPRATAQVMDVPMKFEG